MSTTRAAGMPRKPSYRKPCPDPVKGVRCEVCGGEFVCLQPERKKINPTKPRAALSGLEHVGKESE